MEEGQYRDNAAQVNDDFAGHDSFRYEVSGFYVTWHYVSPHRHDVSDNSAGDAGSTRNIRTCQGLNGSRPKEMIQVSETNQFTRATIGAAIDVHRCLGPGLFESAFHEVKLVDGLHRIVNNFTENN